MMDIPKAKGTTLLWVILILCLITSSASLFLQIFKGDQMVYVDAQKLVNRYEGMKQARKELETKIKIWQANLDSLHSEAEKRINEYAKAGPSLSAKERQLMEELIRSKQQQYDSYQQAITEKIKGEDQELSSKVLSSVNDFIKRYGKEKNYTIIMAATQYGNIVFAKDELDITDEVLKGLNDEFAAR